MARGRGASLLALAAGAALLASRASAGVTAVWANSGDDKVTRDELRATTGSTNTLSRAWDGTAIGLFGGRNEIVSFDLVLESGDGAADVSVAFDSLTGPGGAAIKSTPAAGNGVFDWTRRDIELFYVRYLPIRGLSRIANGTYDERLIPGRFRRPWTANFITGRASGRGTWKDRPDHDKDYPEIAVPLELNPRFDIAARSNQSVWADVYIPKDAPPGAYAGTVKVSAGGKVVRTIPVRLQVRDFSLPDVPSAKTMLYFSSSDLNRRLLGTDSSVLGTDKADKARLLRDRYFMLAHRHRVSLIGDAPGYDCANPGDQPCPEWAPRLDGSLFTAANGYAGPGVKTGNGVYSIGTYGAWSWSKGTEADMRAHADAWATWFAAHFPGAEYFLYLIDESTDYGRIERWSRWLSDDPGPGGRVKSLATLWLPEAAAHTPHLDIPASTISVGMPSEWEPLAREYGADSRKRLFFYNGHRPASGSFVTEDDGTALRELAWGQYKKRVDRWFYWQSTYYNDYQGRGGETDLFVRAQTYGGGAAVENPDVLGQTTLTYGNGDGVLLYPGTDAAFPDHSYGVDGPFASLRLKYWRRGIQDVDYLTLAAARDPAAVEAIVKRMIPKVLWEVGVRNPVDPRYQYADVSWPAGGDAWEDARAKLAAIIESPRQEAR